MANSLNMAHAYDPERVKRFGKLFGTIDFEMNEQLSGEVIRQRRSDTKVGSLKIDGKEFGVTLAEVDRLIETLNSAKDVFYKGYTLGKYG